jgi:hypothetical protein
MPESTYSQDVALMTGRTDIAELTDGAGAALAVAPAWQGRAMTSSLDGADGAGFGWLNAEFIASGTEDEGFNNYGGEDRFWLGPEAGQFGLRFQAGQAFDPANGKTPAGLNRGGFDVTAGDDRSVAMATTDYFGEIPPERCFVGDDHLPLTCDGRFRGKIGISPRRAKKVLGSFDGDAGVLTIVQFNLPVTAPELPYVNGPSSVGA